MKRRILSSAAMPAATRNNGSMPKTSATPVKASAAGTTKGQEAFEEAIANLEENFEFVIQGLEKLSREGGEGPSQSLQLVLECNSAIEQITQKIAGVIRE